MNRLEVEEKSRLRLYLRENGCPVQPESHHRVIPAGLVVEQVPIPMMNTAFDLESGSAAYMLNAHLTSNRARPIRIVGVQIRPPWEGSSISLLKDDPRYRTSGGLYAFPGPGAGFAGSEVLNRLLSGKERLNPRDDVEGLILAMDSQPIPGDVADRGRIVVKVTLFDSAGGEFSSKFRLSVDRSAIQARKRAEEAGINLGLMHRRKPANQIPRRKVKPLFSCPDVATPDKLTARSGSGKNSPSDQDWENFHAAINGTARFVGSRKDKRKCKV